MMPGEEGEKGKGGGGESYSTALLSSCAFFNSSAEVHTFWLMGPGWVIPAKEGGRGYFANLLSS
jgi:hypothetical protein